MSDNIITFGNKTAPATTAEQTYDYKFTTKDGEDYIYNGILTMNPMFYGTVDTDNKMTFSIAADLVKTVQRIEPVKLNS